QIDDVLRIQDAGRLFQFERIDHIVEARTVVVALRLEQRALRQYHVYHVAGANLGTNLRGFERALCRDDGLGPGLDRAHVGFNGTITVADGLRALAPRQQQRFFAGVARVVRLAPARVIESTGKDRVG